MNIYGQTFNHIEQYLQSIGEKPSKAVFIAKGLYQQKASTFDELPLLKAQLKERLSTDFTLDLPEIIEQVESDDTIKVLFSLSDRNVVEAVVMKQKYGYSLCISTQVGCNMGCTFCQSGRLKKIRDLTASEMTTQLLALEKSLSIKISNLVLMGIGEPLDNFDAVMDFIQIINHQQMLNIGMRHISLSTCGLVPKINDYTQHPNVALLAVSLHAPNDELRNQIMPVNRRYPLAQLMDSIEDYITVTKKKVMLEYVMLAGVNDSVLHAQELANLIGSRNCHVNLIPYNETMNLGFTQSSFEQIMVFYDILKKNKIKVTMRREFGTSIKAACGQLRADYHQINQ